MSNTRTEYRAIYRIPASVLASPEEQVRGYVELATGYGEDKQQIRESTYELRRPMESHATIVRWERRTVTVGDWELDA